MKKWMTSCNEIPFATNGDCTEALLNLLNKMSDGDELIFTKGTYFIKEQFIVKNRNNIKIKGYGATIMSHYNPCEPNNCKTPFEFIECKNCSIQGFTFTTDNPTNIWGRIVNVNIEEGYFDVRTQPDTPIVGNEWIEGLDTCNEDLAYNFHIGWADYGSCQRYYKISRDLIRFPVWPSKISHLANVKLGEIICMRYSLYAPGTFSFVGCEDILMEDITVLSCPGEICMVHPRSVNFTFRRINVKLERNSPQVMASNTDGLHFRGIAGKLTIEDCHFENMGDDSLNIHAECGNVYSFDGKTLNSGILKQGHTVDEPPVDFLPDSYARPGDIIHIHDSKTLRKKAEFKVVDFIDNKFTVSDVNGEIKIGDILVNSAYYPETRISNCSISGSRARGFLIKTGNVVVENCTFTKIAGPGILAVCGVDLWHEMGPVHHLTIRDCVFESCGASCERPRTAGIAIGGGPTPSRDSRAFYVEETGVFHDIKLLNNKFYNLPYPAVYATSVKGIEIDGNEFFNCAYDTLPDDEFERYKYNIVTHCCEDVDLSNNTYEINKNELYVESERNQNKL